jgi:hypothetical protein
MRGANGALRELTNPKIDDDAFYLLQKQKLNKHDKRLGKIPTLFPGQRECVVYWYSI